MEVHAHSHTARKKWSHYFWEFFMLFLAVTLGFFVENQREHYIEHLREKQYMVSLVQDLTEDIEILDHQVKLATISIDRMDSLIYLVNSKTGIKLTGRLYFLGRIASRHDIFNYNNRTIDQMRNSGGFRLVRKPDISKQIMDYYRQIRFVEMLEAIEKDEEHEYRRAAVRVFDPVIFNSMVSNNDSIKTIGGDPPLLTQDHNLLTDLTGWTQYMKSSVQGLTKTKAELKDVAANLISSIKKEYHLK